MATVVKCPECGATDFNLAHYESIMVLSSELALFGLRCPHCGTEVSSVCTIPPSLQKDIQCAAMEMDAGMGHGAPSR